MKPENAIEVQNLSKVFTLRQVRVDENGKEVHEHWALKDVSFEIKKGESVGIIGPNGSGKSTLLQILAGVTKPSSGSASIRGKVASILDIGAGFHPELSGKENIFLNGQIHGFTKKEIEDKLDEIVTFSGIEKFIDEPVKNYSNGMYLRLAFSIMANLDFDVYLFDEVLSVGDKRFREKINERILKKRNNQASTFIFVTHNVSEIVAFAENSMEFKNGKCIAYGKSVDILTNHLMENKWENKADQFQLDAGISDINMLFFVNDIQVSKVTNEDSITVKLQITKNKTTNVKFAIRVRDFLNNVVFVSSYPDELHDNIISQKDFVELMIHIPKCFLNKGNFTFDVIGYNTNKSKVLFNYLNAGKLEIVYNSEYSSNFWMNNSFGPVRPYLEWEIADR